MAANNPEKIDIQEKKKRVIDVIKSRFPPDFQKALMNHLRPSARLIPHYEPTRTFLGGAPDSPLQEGWPRFPGFPNGVHPERWAAFAGRPLPFIAQIDLTALKTEGFCGSNIPFPLPDEGLLRFFYLDAMAAFRLYPENGEIFRVIYQPPDPFEPTSFPDDLPEDQCYQQVFLRPVIEWTLPPVYALTQTGIPEKRIKNHLALWESLSEEVRSVQGFAPFGEPIHRVLGYPDQIQWPDFDLGSQLLMQVGSDISWAETYFPKTGIAWGDAGRVFFQIEMSDLCERHWAAVWCSMETA